MRTIKRTSAFKKDFKKVFANPHHTKDIDNLLKQVLVYLVQDLALPDSYNDHELIGNWKGHRECHIKSNLLLLYKKEDIYEEDTENISVQEGIERQEKKQEQEEQIEQQEQEEQNIQGLLRLVRLGSHSEIFKM